MKQLKKSMTCIAIALTIGACGSDSDVSSSAGSLQKPQTRSYSGMIGSCQLSGPKGKLCMEFSYSGILASDPSSTITSQSRTACNQQNNILDVTASFIPNTPCSRSAAVGYCKYSESKAMNGESYSLTIITTFEVPMTADHAENACKYIMKGTYSRTAP